MIIAALLMQIPLAQNPVPPALEGLETWHADGTYEFGCHAPMVTTSTCLYLPAADWVLLEWGGCVEREVHLGSINYTCKTNPNSNCWIRFQHFDTGEKRTYGKDICDGSAIMRVAGAYWHVHYDWVISN